MEDDDDKRTPLSKSFGTNDDFPSKDVMIFPPSNLPVAGSEDEFNTRYVDADYEYTRTNTMQTIEKMDNVIDEMAQFARAAQSPRAYEVLATMFKVQLDAQKDLLELAKRNKDLKEQERSQGETQVTNNTLVVTNDQLLKMLKDQGIETKTRKLDTKNEE